MLRTETESRTAYSSALAGSRGWPSDLCQVRSLGRLSFGEAWALQRKLVEERRAGAVPDTLLLLEHSPVITLGRNARREHILSSEEELERAGIELAETNRGGDVTFHGPGQVVGYPILDLSRIRKDVGWYLRALEEALIRAVGDFGLEAGRRAGMTGVWIGEHKVAAIGVHISRWITSHGFALNVSTDLEWYRHIVPCGICAYPVGSLEESLGRPVEWRAVEASVARHFGEVFGKRMEFV